MSDYDFQTLNDKEFEVFCADVLGDLESTRFERFKSGRDAGVDGRFFKADGTEIFLQCKHWVNTPISQLVARLKNKEIERIKKLNPSRYFLAVSNSLSRNDKAKISEVLAPYIRSQSDIFGKEDLNDLLRKKPKIEQRHYKLWLCSTAVLSHLINKPIFDRSKFSAEEIVEFSKKYVVTSHHERAISKLQKLGTLIVTGEPGVGKTTLAENVCLWYLGRGFQFFKISEEIREAEAVFEDDEKQIFYFDDFLGENYLEALSGHEGSHIVQFIKRVSKSKKKRFILTSRSTILNQGKGLISRLQTHDTSLNEYELTVAALSEMDKARILYSHIWHSKLPEEFIERIYEDKRYQLITKHQNYNPRLISFITDASRHSGRSASQYWPFIQESLNNPTDVWDNPFIAQQDDFGRALVLLVTLEGGRIEEASLSESYGRFIANSHLAGMQGRRDFIFNIRHLTGSLLARSTNGKQASLRLFNPSLGDYVLNRYCRDLGTLKAGFMSLRTPSSLSTIRNLLHGRFITWEIYGEILAAILRGAEQQSFIDFHPWYIAQAIAMVLGRGEPTQDMEILLTQIIEFLMRQPVPRNIVPIVSVYAWALERKKISDAFAVCFVRAVCEERLSEEELDVIASFFHRLDGSSEDLEEVKGELRVRIAECLADEISTLVFEGDAFDGLDPNDYDEGRNNVREIVESRLSDFNLDFDELVVDELVDSYDVVENMDEYFGGSVDDSWPNEPTASSAGNEEIDDLFESDRYS